MKTQRFFALPLALLILLFSVTSCEKLSDEELLTDHIWRFEKITTTSSNQDVQTMIALVGALMTNSTLEFRSDGTYSMTVLTSTDDGTWQLMDGNTLRMDTDDMNIVKLTKDSLVLGGEETDTEYGTYSVTMYWVK